MTVTLIKTIPLSLIGGTGVTAQLAGNSQYLFAGTNQSLVATQITTSGWAVTEFGAGSPSAPVAAITANSRGVITVTFGPPNPSFYVFSAGRGDEDGGGEEFMVGTQNGVAPLVP